MLDVFRTVAQAVDLPLTLGGGIKSLADIEDALDAGAQKVSMSSAAVREPELIERAAREFASERIVVAIDVDASDQVAGGYEVYIDGGRTPTGIDALEFARAAVGRGAGTLLPTSKRCDGTREGYDIPLLKGMTGSVEVPVVASGGAGRLEHFYEAATEGGAAVLLAASVFHFGEIKIPELKQYLDQKGVNVRLGGRA
jgi:cyclase